MHVDIIVQYVDSIIQQHPGRDIIKNNYSLTCIKMIDPNTEWFDIAEIPTLDLYEVTADNDECIDK